MQVVESTPAVPTFAPFFFLGFDADGDLLDFAITRLPSHGSLLLVSTLDPSGATYDVITNIPYQCWDTYSRYRLSWIPAEYSNEPVNIGYRAWDGVDWSAEASIEVMVQAFDSAPIAIATNYSTDEDTALYDITLHAIDVDSDFVSIFITELPAHGKLFQLVHDSDGTLVQGDEITQAYSPWEIVPPIKQYLSNVSAVSTFWPAGDSLDNGYPSWHPYRE